MGLAVRVRYRSSDGGVYGEREMPHLPVRFGRNAMNDCVIEHPQVSQFHAVVELIDGQLGVRDLHSKNGIYAAPAGRLPAERFVPLATTGHVFSLGPAVHVQIEPVEYRAPVGERSSAMQGQVIGGPSMMGDFGREGRGVASLPPLSFEGGGSPQRPPPQPMPWSPGPSGPAGTGQSLPPLDPLSAYGGLPGAGPLPYEPPAAAAKAGAPRAVGRSTQQFTMAVDALALTGLRELAGSFVPGAPLQTTGDVARLLTKLHDTIEVFCRCFVPLRAGYEQFLSTIQLRRAASQRSFNRSKSALALEGARDPATVAAALLDWRNQDFDPPRVLESIFADLVMHHVAVVEGMMRGVQALLDELSPESIQRSLAEHGSPAMLGRYRALWQTFKARHDELERQSRSFELAFGEEFAASYREYMEKQRSQQ